MHAAFLPGQIGYSEVLLLLLVILLLFGAKRLPDLARSLGRSLGEFKKGRQDGEREAGDQPASKDPSADDKKAP